jgi:hypothetical protein
VVNLDREPVKGLKVMLKPNLVIGNQYGDNRKYTQQMHDNLRGVILTVNATAGSIFNMTSASPMDVVLHKSMVDELKDVNSDILFDSYIIGAISEKEYEKLRRERG